MKMAEAGWSVVDCYRLVMMMMMTLHLFPYVSLTYSKTNTGKKINVSVA